MNLAPFVSLTTVLPDGTPGPVIRIRASEIISIEPAAVGEYIIGQKRIESTALITRQGRTYALYPTVQQVADAITYAEKGGTE